MCNTTTIGALIASACISIILAVVALAVAAANAGTFWGAFGNAIPMGIAAGLIAVALGLVNAAVAQVTSSCRTGPCKAQADALFNALVACATALTVLLTAVVVGIFAASIPWAGVVVALALGVAAVACGISLGLISWHITTLDTCLVGPGAPETPAVTVAKIAAILAMAACFALAAGTGALPPGPRPG
jgi:hypothetical protein